METGVRSTEFENFSTIDEVFGNKDGSTGRMSVEALISLFLARSGPSYETLSDLQIDLKWPEGAIASVFGDQDELKIGIYKKAGNIGAGTWSWIGELPLTPITKALLASKADSLQLFEEADLRNAADIETRLLLSEIANGDIRVVGEFDASLGAFPSGSIAGNIWRVRAGGAGVIDGRNFAVNDTVQALVDDASTTEYAGSWVHGSNSDVLSAATVQTFKDKSSLVVSTQISVGQRAKISGRGEWVIVEGGTYDVGPMVFDLEGVSGQAVSVELTQDVPARGDTRSIALLRSLYGQSGLVCATYDGSPYLVDLGQQMDADLVTAGGVGLVAKEERGSDVRIDSFISENDALDADGWPLDWSPILQRAYYRSLALGKVYIDFQPSSKDYIFNSSLDISAGHFVALRGPSDGFARGTSWFGETNFNRVRVRWNAPTAAQYWIEDDSLFSEKAFVGPYFVENITVICDNLGRAFRFGSDDIDGDGTKDDFDSSDPTVTQSFVYRARIKGCYIKGDEGTDRSHDSTGAINTNGQLLYSLSKGFQCSIEDTAFEGGDEQIYMFGCDRPVISFVRGGRCKVGIRMVGSGSYAVNHVVQNYQIEGYALAAVISDGVSTSLTNLRTEGQGGVNDRGLDLPETANVNSANPVIYFSGDMTDKLFPRTSVIKVTDPATGLSFNALVDEVKNTAVTLHSDGYFQVPWTANPCTVRRYCPSVIHVPGAGDAGCSVSGGTVNPTANNPAFVYVAGRGEMAISGVTRTHGVESSDFSSLVVGNRMGDNGYLNARMAFIGCSPLLLADPHNPFVTIPDMPTKRTRLDGYSASNRAPYGSISDEGALTTRPIKVLTPKNSSTSSGGNSATLMEELPFDNEVGTTIWAWYKSPTRELAIRDETILSDDSMWVRVRVLASTALAGTGVTLKYYFTDNGGSSTYSHTLPSSGWAWVERVVPMPFPWRTNGNAMRAIAFPEDGGNEYYVAAVSLEFLTESDGVFCAGTYTNPMRMGGRVEWYDSVGNKRAKVTSGLPTSEVDGVIISQAPVI